MDVNIEKTGFFQGESLQSCIDAYSSHAKTCLTILACFAGEGLKVLACIENKSSREIKPKYCVYRKHSFFAQGKRRVHTKDLLKEVGEPIPPSADVKVTRVINIPHDMEPSILNCSIIKVEHRLRVSLYDQDHRQLKYKIEKEGVVLSTYLDAASWTRAQHLSMCLSVACL